MIKFAKLIVTVWLLFIVLSALAIVIGTADHTKPGIQAAGFDTCGEKPCFLGIVSALTSWSDVTQKLTLYGTVTNMGNLVEVYAGDGANLYRVIPEPDAKTVAGLEIYVQNNPQFPTLQELIRLYGAPCGIVYPRQSGTLKVVTLLYPFMDIEITQSAIALSLNSKITVVSFVDPTRITGNQNLCTLKSLEKAPVLPWHGFASWQYYTVHGLFQTKE